MKKIFVFKKYYDELADLTNQKIWAGFDELIIDDYRWMDNDYKPLVKIRGFYTDMFIYLFYNVFEDRVTARYTNINDPVFKDSCVEFFINLFPKNKEEYFNIEMNVIGTVKMGYGIKRNRSDLNPDDVKKIKVLTSVKTPITGVYGNFSWQLYCAIPFSLLESYTGLRFTKMDAIGNFYKCGDETEFKHYGMWNPVNNPKPDFHLPEFFGKFIFQK